MARARSRRRHRKQKSHAGHLSFWLKRCALVGAVALFGYAAWLDLTVRTQFDGKRWAVPARVYARPVELYAGARLTPGQLEYALAAAGYKPVRSVRRSGTYHRDGSTVQFSSRSFDYWDMSEPEQRLSARFDGTRLVSLQAEGKDVAIARVEPALVGRIYPSHLEDRILVKLEQVPPLLVEALLAAEDRSFFEHAGLSPRGIARALMVNMRAGETLQGGSTLTQQLAKNFFLSSERTFWRKANEALLALLLEARYSKEEILEAYLNEIHLGQERGRSIHGFGSGKPVLFSAAARRARATRDCTSRGASTWRVVLQSAPASGARTPAS